MFDISSRLHATRLVATTLALTMAVTLGLLAGSAGGASAAVAPSVSEKIVARSPQGELNSRISGTTGNGRRVSGHFIPLRVVKRDGQVRVRGLIQGVVHNRDGSTRTFSALRTPRLRSIDGTPVTSSRTLQRAATCDVLNLRLGPLDLNVLGLQIDLNRIVLDIVAVTGAGNLLGNLICAVAGLLDGGLAGALGRLTRLLNRILGQLGLGV